MELIFLVIQIILAIAIIGTILLQKTNSDGISNLSSGNSINNSSIISSRASASFLTKATSFLMICFMINSLILGNLSSRSNKKTSIVESGHQAPISESPTSGELELEKNQVPVSD